MSKNEHTNVDAVTANPTTAPSRGSGRRLLVQSEFQNKNRKKIAQAERGRATKTSLQRANINCKWLTGPEVFGADMRRREKHIFNSTTSSNYSKSAELVAGLQGDVRYGSTALVPFYRYTGTLQMLSGKMSNIIQVCSCGRLVNEDLRNSQLAEVDWLGLLKS